MIPSPAVAVLLPTFNGELYISDLLDSVLTQSGVEVILCVRDDGSRDRTPSILKEYARRHTNIILELGENIGVNASFIQLLEAAPTAEYYAFCDQDDLWLSDKLSRAVATLKSAPTSTPALYGSAVQVVDMDLKPMRSPKHRVAQAGLANALLENILPGCTMVMNDDARRMIMGRFPAEIRMYDWWIYQVISAIGHVVRDEQPSMLYRQHGNNTVGSANGFHLWVRRLKRAISRDRDAFICRHAEFLLAAYSEDMSPTAHRMITNFLASRAHFRSRIDYAIRGPWSRSREIDNAVFRLLYLLKRL